MRFKVGDLVTSSGKTFSKDKRVGKVIRVHLPYQNNGVDFLVYNVKYPGESMISEYHAGELKRVKI